MVVNIEINQHYLHILTFWDYQDSESMIKTDGLSITISCTSLKFSIDTLIFETKTVVTERHAFERRDESVLKAVLGVFRLWVH